MSKALLIIIALVIFSSCTKEKVYTCKCFSQATDTRGIVTIVKQDAKYTAKTKTKANTMCQEQEVRINSNFTSSGGTATTTCAIE